MIVPADFEGEQILTLSQLARLVPGGKAGHLDPRVLLRYVLSGEKINGQRVKLLAFRYGRGPWRSSREKLRDFLDTIERRLERPITPQAHKPVRVPQWAEQLADRMGL